MDGSSQDFERWRTRGDSDALARVFDAQAPGLLRFAVHLVGDANAAEDLVQETFLAALRSAGNYDAARPIDRWLAGILVHRAQQLRREARRVQSREVPETWDLDTPFESAARREISAELARAVDALEEPYRAAILLNLHGLEPAVIAHVLGRSPGAVRVQLHRAREMLRKALPVGMAGALVLLGESARGLGSVRNHVLEHAARLAPAAGIGGGLLGGAIVMKKLVVAAVVLVLLLAGLAGLLARGDAPAPEIPTASRERDRAEQAAPAAETASLASDAGRSAAIEVRPTSAPTAAHRFAGRVLAAHDDAPVGNALVELHAPRRIARDEYQRWWTPRAQPSRDGWPFPRSPSSESQTIVQLAGLEPVLDYAPPATDAAPIASVRTDADGRFDLPSAEATGILVVRAEGFGLRRHVWTETDTRTVPRDVYVARSGRVTGRLVDEAGAAVERRALLVLSGLVQSRLGSSESSSPSAVQVEAWEVETGEDGRFAIDVAAQVVFVHSADPTFDVLRWQPTDAKDARDRRPWLAPAEDARPVDVVIRRGCVLSVRDARTGAPIERVRLVARRAAGVWAPYTAWDGWFAAPDGLVRLTPELRNARDRAEGQGPWNCTVWAHGYLPLELAIAAPWEPGVVEARLEPGRVAALRGRVVRGADAVAGTPVVVVPANVHAWSPPSDAASRVPAGAARTDRDGRFEIELLPGRYVVRVGEGGEAVSTPVLVPGEELVLDLAASASLVVRVRRADGAPAAATRVRVDRPDRGVVTLETDARGEARVAATCAGEHVVRVSDPELDVERWVAEAQVEAFAGRESVLELVAAETRARYGRLVLEDGTSARGWKAQVRHWSDSLVDIAPDGRVPIDLRSADNGLEFRGPDGRRVVVNVPKDARDGHEFAVDGGSRGYEGVLRSLADGSPLAQVDVLAFRVDRAKLRTVVATTDASGRFRLVGLDDAPYEFALDRALDDEPLEGFRVRPDDMPADPPRRLELALPLRRDSAFPGAETIRLRGRLTWAGQQVEGVQAHLTAHFAVPGAGVSVTQILMLPADGRYDVPLPLGARYSAWLWQQSTGAKHQTEWTGSGAPVEARDIDVP